MSRSILATVASALSFAHLSGLNRGPAAESNPPSDKDEDDKDDEKGASADEPPADNDKKGAADPAAPAAIAPAALVAAQGPSIAEVQATARSEGAKAERDRCAAIFAAPAAARNVAMAAELAFGTDLSAERAIALLDKTPAPAAAAGRAARNPNVGASAPAVNPQQATAARWDAHLQQANPNRRA
jgi:hypothetical protein